MIFRFIVHYFASRFVYLSNLNVPLEDGRKDNVFISKSLDATSHFETMYQDMADLYFRILEAPLEIFTRDRAL